MKDRAPTANFRSCWPLPWLLASPMSASEGAPSLAPGQFPGAVADSHSASAALSFLTSQAHTYRPQHEAQFQGKCLEKGSQPWPETSSDLSILPPWLSHTPKHFVPSLIPGLQYKVDVIIIATTTTTTTEDQQQAQGVSGLHMAHLLPGGNTSFLLDH